MSRQIIFIGTTDNDGTGDPLRLAFSKTNGNFQELYTNTDNVLEIAWAGTATANQALATAQIGTNLAQEARDNAYAALLTAWSGTNGANAALVIASAGTNLGQHANDVATVALQTSWAGTQAANYAASVAVACTIAGNEARKVADKALLTAWSGTNGANAALTIAIAGTNAAKGPCGFSFVIDGGGAVITTGLKGYIEIPFGMWLTRWTILGDQSGNIVVDVLKSSGYAGFPTVPSIAASAKPTLSGVQKNENTTLVGWTRQLNQGDIIGFTVNSASTVLLTTVALAGTRS
jgi:hypothetical protein